MGNAAYKKSLPYRRVWDMRMQKIVKTMDTGKEVTSIEITQQGKHITTADGNEVLPSESCCLSGIRDLSSLQQSCQMSWWDVE